jgi:hypothetical protein
MLLSLFTIELGMVIIYLCTWSNLIVIHDVFLVSILKYKALPYTSHSIANVLIKMSDHITPTHQKKLILAFTCSC